MKLSECWIKQQVGPSFLQQINVECSYFNPCYCRQFLPTHSLHLHNETDEIGFPDAREKNRKWSRRWEQTGANWIYLRRIPWSGRRVQTNSQLRLFWCVILNVERKVVVIVDSLFLISSNCAAGVKL